MGTPIDGIVLAATIRARVRENIAHAGLHPTLAVVLVGDDPASHLYVRLKERACAEVGIRFERHERPASTTTEELRALVRTLGRQSDVHGILIQLPLPPTVDTDAVIAVIPPTKDADGFHPQNLTRLQRGNPLVVPALAKAILALLEATREPLRGKRAALLAKSATVCRPMEWLLQRQGVDCIRFAPFHPDRGRPEHTASADILVSALGCGQCLDASYVRPNAILMDIGIARGADGKIVGDFTPDAHARAAWFTPVPGGVGPMTVAMLLENVAEAAMRKSAP